MADKSYKLTLSLSDGSTINAGIITAPQGPTGANGVTFIPSVSEAGVLSWTNNGGLTNPDPVNIKGDDAVITESDVAGWGFTKNTGTITGIKMNGASKGTSGVIDLGTVLTAHQDISGKQDKITSSNKLAASLVSGLAAVATSGSYNDLSNKPTIPTDYVPNTRKVNNKALSSDITLGASDVGALPTAGGTITGNLAVGGNLTINGTTTTVDSTTLQVKDKLIEVAHGNTATLTTPAGLVAPKYDGTNSGALVFDSTGTAYVGDVTLKDGNIDVANSGLQPLATRTGLVGGNLVQYDSSAQTLKDSGKKISDLALKTDIPTNYVTTDTTQAISGKKTVVTPPDTDDSTQIANTAWVRSHNQAIRGFDGPNYYTVNDVKTYYPADNYFLVAYTDHCVNWKHVCAEMDVVDFDTRRAVYKLKVSGLLESATSNNITTYTNKGNIGVTDSFGERLNTGTTDINNDFFLVCRTTNKGRVRYEIWYNQRYSYNRHKFYFSVDEAHARTGVTQHFTWNKMRVDNAADVNYAKAGVTAYMESGNINPTYIPTSSWGVDVFKTALSDDESYTNITIFNNNLYSTTQVGVSTILNTTPYIDAKIKGYSGYKTIPSAQKTAEYRILSEDKGYLGGIRYDKYTNGDSGTRLCVASTLSGASNSVMIYATKGTASTKNTDSNIWAFVPATDDNIALGGSGNRWLNGYITNIQGCKVINGGGGNSLIQQNSDTSGADITVGSTACNLKLQAKTEIDVTKSIGFVGSGKTLQMIKFIDGNADGHGIVIGGGGLAVFGSGESASATQSGFKLAGTTEHTYITSDNYVHLLSNCQTFANRKELTFNNSGQLVYTPTAGGTSYTYTLPQATGQMMVGSLSGTTLTITM